MSSSREQIVAALDAAEASYRDLASLPLEVLTRPEKQELLIFLTPRVIKESINAIK